MRAITIVTLLSAALGSTVPASAQINPAVPPALQPAPPPSPPTRVEPAPIPKLDTLPSRTYPPPPRPSFGDRATNCLHEGAVAGLSPTDRAAYARSCANRD